MTNFQLTRNPTLEQNLNGGRLVYDVVRTDNPKPVGSIMLGIDNQWRIVGGTGNQSYGMIVDAAGLLLR